jgi:hypothetical protein
MTRSDGPTRVASETHVGVNGVASENGHRRDVSLGIPMREARVSSGSGGHFKGHVDGSVTLAKNEDLTVQMVPSVPEKFKKFQTGKRLDVIDNVLTSSRAV